jgi:hypothetical protein
MNQETLNELNRKYHFLTQSNLSENEIRDIRALANDIGNDEYKLTEFVIARARFISDNAKTQVLMDLSSKIEERLRVFVTADLQKTLWELKENLQDIAHIADKQISYSANRITSDAQSVITKAIAEDIHKKIKAEKKKTNILAIALSISVSLLIGLGAGYFGFRFFRF